MDSSRDEPLKSDPHTAKAKGGAAKAIEANARSPRITTFITRLPTGGGQPPTGHRVLIHGSAIKSQAK